jgi:hypothetical protein
MIGNVILIKSDKINYLGEDLRLQTLLILYLGLRIRIPSSSSILYKQKVSLGLGELSNLIARHPLRYQPCFQVNGCDQSDTPAAPDTGKIPSGTLGPREKLNAEAN